MATNQEWTRAEVEAIVADYLRMLNLELAGQAFNKASHRRLLRMKIQHRSDSSIEFKHGNISAVLIDLGYPYIRGYQPRSNFQSLLHDVVADQLSIASGLDALATAAVQLPAVSPVLVDFPDIEVDAPIRKYLSAEPKPIKDYLPVQRDYLARESANRSLGLAGEEFVVQYEQWRLRRLGVSHLADRVEHVSHTKGDGLGYDVLSFDFTGRERYIEVKTTTFGKETPFFLTQNELRYSRDAGDQFRLCRLFQFRQGAKMFSLRGALDAHCSLDPVTYRATF